MLTRLRRHIDAFTLMLPRRLPFELCYMAHHYCCPPGASGTRGTTVTKQRATIVGVTGERWSCRLLSNFTLR